MYCMWLISAYFKVQSKKHGRMASAQSAIAYNGGLGAEPLAGSRAEPLVRGSGGRSPPEAESILVIFLWMSNGAGKFSTSLC